MQLGERSGALAAPPTGDARGILHPGLGSLQLFVDAGIPVMSGLGDDGVG